MDATVGELGEVGLIAAITERLTTSSAVLLGPGDDAAVIAAPDARVVASTDMLVEGRHFRRAWSEPADVGHRAAAANLADIAAMGAVPTALLVGLAVPAELPTAWVTALADGMHDECLAAGAVIVGGDVVRSDTLVISVTALGSLEGREAVTRSGAVPGDLVAVAGRLGWAAAGLAVLSRGFRSPRILVDAHRRPAPPYAEGPRAAALGATAMTDVSDGLLADLGHVAVASGVSRGDRVGRVSRAAGVPGHRPRAERRPDGLAARRWRRPRAGGDLPAGRRPADGVERRREGRRGGRGGRRRAAVRRCRWLAVVRLNRC